MKAQGNARGGRPAGWVLLLSIAAILLVPGTARSGAVDEPDGAGVPAPAATQQRPGTLDSSFGGEGWSAISFFGGFINHTLANIDAVALQPDGKIVAVGSASSFSNVLSSAMARFNPDGTLDATFSGGGGLVAYFGPDNQPKAVAIQPDGRILVVAATPIVRLNADGSLDTGFGSGGLATAQSGGVNVIHRAIALQPDGGIVAAGALGGNFALVRYLPDGSLDTGFGMGGIATTSDAGGATALFLQPEGGILAAATTPAGFFSLLRYNPDGTLDTGYGTGGIVTTDFAGPGSGVALQPDGKFIVVGSIQKGTVDFLIARYNPDGRADKRFGGHGKTITNIHGDDAAHAVLLRPDGRIVVAGGYYKDRRGKPESGFALVRYTSSGKLDGSFGSGGKTLTDFYPNDTVRKNPDISFSSAASSLALQPDGRVLAAGYLGIVIEFGQTQFVVARYF